MFYFCWNFRKALIATVALVLIFAFYGCGNKKDIEETYEVIGVLGANIKSATLYIDNDKGRLHIESLNPVPDIQGRIERAPLGSFTLISNDGVKYEFMWRLETRDWYCPQCLPSSSDSGSGYVWKRKS